MQKLFASTCVILIVGFQILQIETSAVLAVGKEYNPSPADSHFRYRRFLGELKNELSKSAGEEYDFIVKHEAGKLEVSASDGWKTVRDKAKGILDKINI